MNVREKLSIIQADFKAKKSRKNSFGNYMFRSAEDILEALKPMNVKYNVYFTIDENLTLGDFPIMHSTASIVDTESGDQITASSVVGIDLNQKGMQMPQKFGSASSYGKKYALGNLFLIDDTADSDATNDHGKGASVIERVTKPAITSVQLLKAKDYIAAGGDIKAIQSKYKLTQADINTINGTKKDITKA